MQLELNETEEMLLLIGELEEQLELERQRADVLERKAAFAAGFEAAMSSDKQQ